MASSLITDPRARLRLQKLLTEEFRYLWDQLCAKHGEGMDPACTGFGAHVLLRVGFSDVQVIPVSDEELRAFLRGPAAGPAKAVEGQKSGGCGCGGSVA